MLSNVLMFVCVSVSVWVLVSVYVCVVCALTNCIWRRVEEDNGTAVQSVTDGSSVSSPA